jgi:hypothetical protein
MYMKTLLLTFFILVISMMSLSAAKIEDIKLKIYNQEEGIFRESADEFHFNQFGPFMFEVVLKNDDDNTYYTEKNGLEITLKIGKKTVYRKIHPFQLVSDEYYFPVFIEEAVICKPVTVTARIKALKGSEFVKKFEFSCGE